MLEINWHYPRVDLARAYLSQFAAGITHAITLFAPRRKGKTEFLVDDLAPAAKAAGYHVVYVSLWALKTDPARALLDGLVDSAKRMSAFNRARKLLATPVSKLEAEGAVSGAKIKLGEELAVDQKIDPAILLELLLDEVQFLAKPVYEDFIAALRTALDTRKRAVHVVFTGSSRSQLHSIQAPLFQFSQATTFPDLQESFTSFMASNFLKATGRHLVEREAWEGFNLLGCSPGLFREAINNAAMGGGTDILEHCRRVRDLTVARSDLRGVWNRLRVLDRLVLRSVLRGDGIYSTKAREEYARTLGLDSLSTSPSTGGCESSHLRANPLPEASGRS